MSVDCRDLNFIWAVQFIPSALSLSIFFLVTNMYIYIEQFHSYPRDGKLINTPKRTFKANDRSPSFESEPSGKSTFESYKVDKKNKKTKKVKKMAAWSKLSQITRNYQEKRCPYKTMYLYTQLEVN